MKKDEKQTLKTERKYVTILGINIDSSPIGQLLTGVEKKITDSYKLGSRSVKFCIVTPNPELVLMAQDDKFLKEALNGADFAPADGIGLSMAAKFISLPSPKNKFARLASTFFQGAAVGLSVIFYKKWITDILPNIKGRELFYELIKTADKNHWKVFFLGGENDEAFVAARKLRTIYKNVMIKTEQGPMFNSDGEPATEVDRKLYLDIVDKINDFAPQLLILGLSDPKEEKWVYKYHNKLNIGGAVALGGTFRYIAGLSKLPPKWISDLGLEWLWRLIMEPHRFKRILNAWPIFPIKVWMWKLKN